MRTPSAGSCSAPERGAAGRPPPEPSLRAGPRARLAAGAVLALLVGAAGGTARAWPDGPPLSALEPPHCLACHMDAAETGAPPALAVAVTDVDAGRVRIELSLESAGARAAALVAIAPRDGGPEAAIAADPQGGVISHGAIAQLVEAAEASAQEDARSRAWTLTVTLSCPSRGRGTAGGDESARYDPALNRFPETAGLPQAVLRP